MSPVVMPATRTLANVRPERFCVRTAAAARQINGGRANRSSLCGHRGVTGRHAYTADAPTDMTSPESSSQAGDTGLDYNQSAREGHFESTLMQLQASKTDDEQPSISSILERPDSSEVVDVTVVGCGPAGLSLAANLAANGVKVCLLGPDVPFVNNYGVWVDEFKELGLQHTLDKSWDDAVSYFGEGKQVKANRAYGRVCRRRLRAHLLQKCRDNGVSYLEGELVNYNVDKDGASTLAVCKDGHVLRSRLLTLAAGAVAGKFLKYEKSAPTVAAQTAYGIDAEVEGYDSFYPADAMLFMDYRRHHTGLPENCAPKLQVGQHPNGGDGVWGSKEEVPSFLYAMPLGGKRVFLEETALVAKPVLPFAVLKRRLLRRLKAVGVKVVKVHEEEWSYIPVGGPLPDTTQPITAFGAAANMVHPATGYSVSRSLREAPSLAAHMASVLRKNLPVQETAEQVWEYLWPQEKKRQAAFHVFGMELLANMDLEATNEFFNTFFKLPASYWRGFLGASLSSVELIVFALLVFTITPLSIKTRLVGHLMADPAGAYVLRAYTAHLQAATDQSNETGGVKAKDQGQFA